MARNDPGEQKGSSGKKCVEMKMEDRISKLPDVMLLHILSFLPMCQVVQTSILSRRWRHLWTRVPVLDFRTLLPQFTHWGIESSINCCLMLHNAPKIRKFHACVDFTNIHRCYLDTWLRFAVQHDVEELDMDYIAGCHGSNAHFLFLYLMPGCLFHCGALRALRLRFCELKLPASFCLGSLRTLELYHVIFASELNTSGCPLLESLLLHGCNNRSHLSIYSPNQKLEMLKICDVHDVLYAASDLIIDAPHLSSIEISGYMRKFGYYIKNLSSVTHACLDFTDMFRTVYYFEDQMFVKLLESLSHVKSLELCPWCIQDIDLKDESILENSPFRTTCLALGTSLSRREIRGMTQLLNNLHYLETLIVDIQKIFGYVRRNIAGSEGWEMLQHAMSCLLHLKTVWIYNFFCTDIVSLSGETRNVIDKILKYREKEIKLLKVVLKSCKMLDKMFISTINIQDPTKWMLIAELFLSLTEELQNFPWVSANAEIYLS